MRYNEKASLDYVFKDEGGYAERNTEGGGAVNMGITFTVFVAWRQAKGIPHSTFADLKAMTREEAADIYRAHFLSSIHFDDMPSGVDYVVLNAAIQGGVTGSIKLLQTALKLKPVDGHYGLVTRWAATHRRASDLINWLCAEQLAKYKTFKRFTDPYKEGATRTWGDIWTARIKLVNKRAQAMVQSQ